ncbi:MAG: pyroglutamyl-peptidase I [Polyangiales bacterium]
MTAAPTVLLTAFEPFDGQALNASQLALRAMSPANLPGVTLVREELPCVFGESLKVLRAHIRRHAPSLVICVGQAGGRNAVSLERVAINVDDARIADNDGAQPIDAPIAKRGPVGYWSTLPIKAIAEAIKAEGLPAEISQTAGTFVCNHVFYGLMRTLKRRSDCRGGFVHVPFVPAQAKGGHASLSAEDTARALETLVRVAMSTHADVRVAGGATH